MMAEHRIASWPAPDNVTLRCSCGWVHRESRRQNALARSAKERAAVAKHEREIAPDKVLSFVIRSR